MLRLLALFAIAGLGFFGLSEFAEHRLVYPFDATHVTPGAAELAGVREHRLPTSDGKALVLWLAAPSQPDKPVIVYYHGNAGNLAMRAGRFRAFLARGYGLAALAYRGSSGSSGTPSEDALTRDAIALHLALPGLIGDRRLIYYGESLGTGVAVAALSSRAVSSTMPAALVLEAPYTSLPDVAAHVYPQLSGVTDLLRNTWQTKRRITGVNVPLLVLHGTQDALIPIAQGQEVFAQSPATDKTFHAVTGAGHTDVWQPGAQAVLFDFLARH